MPQAPMNLYPPNGTYDDILSILARAEERRYFETGKEMPRKSAGKRWTLEPVFNSVGLALSAASELLPGELWGKWQNTVLGLAAGRDVLPFAAEAAGLEKTRALCAKIERDTGRAPALLCSMSHPPVTPEWLNLNVEMARQMLLALRVARGRPCRPRLIVAVDSYALDMLPMATEGLYAGYMSRCHLGFDRLSHGRCPPSRFLLRHAVWERIAWRIAETLSAGREVGFVLAGGIPTTARVLYTVREFLGRLRSQSGVRADVSRIAARLEAVQPDFGRFLDSGLIGPELRRNPRRAAEAWVAARMVGEWPLGVDGRLHELESGQISPSLRECLKAASWAFGASDEAFDAGMEALAAEFGRETPYRERFFRFLAHRVVAGRRPLVLIPLRHRVGAPSESGRRTVSLGWGTPAALLESRDGRVLVREGDGSTEKTLGIAEFARTFVASHYP